MASGSSKFFKGVSSQTIITLGLGVLEVAYFSIMSRLLSKEDFGYFAAISGIVAIFYSFSEAGLGSAIIQKKEESASHINTAFTLSAISGTFFALLLFCFASPLAKILDVPAVTNALRIMSVILIINSLNSVGGAILRRHLQFMKAGIIQIVSFVLGVAIAIIMALKGFGFYALVAQGIIYPLFMTIGYYSHYVKLPKFQINKQDAKSILNFGGWLTASVVFSNLRAQIDKILLPRLLSVAQLGAYNRPAGFVTTISSKLNGIFDTVLFPMLSQIQDDRDKVQMILKKSVSLLNCFSVTVAAGFFFNAHLIMEIFFGHQWLELAYVLQIVAIGVIFNINGRLVDCYFRSLNLVKLGFYLRVVAFAIATIAVIAGSQWGIPGVAIAMVVANIIQIVIKMAFLCKKVGVSFLSILPAWVKAWVLFIPWAIAYFAFIAFSPNHTIANGISYLAIFSIILIIEACFFPSLFGSEYKHIIYPKIQSMIKKFKR